MPSHYLGGHFFGFNFFKTLPLNKFNSESSLCYITMIKYLIFVSLYAGSKDRLRLVFNHLTIYLYGLRPIKNLIKDAQKQPNV